MEREWSALLILCANLINVDIKVNIRRSGDGWFVFDGSGDGCFTAVQSSETKGSDKGLVELTLDSGEARAMCPHEAFVKIAARMCVPVKKEDEFTVLSDSVREELYGLMHGIRDGETVESDGNTPVVYDGPIEHSEEGIPAGGFDCTEDLEFVIDYIGISYEEIADENGEPSFNLFYSFIEKKRTEIEDRLDRGASAIPMDEIEDMLRFIKYADGFAEMLGGMTDNPCDGSDDE